MKSIRRYSLLTTLVSLSLVLVSTMESFGFATRTHSIMNEIAADRPVLNGFLSQQLNFPAGLQDNVNGKTVLEWIRLGGAAEDQFLSLELLGGLFRSSRHFHNPLRIWDQCGLQFVFSFECSVRWAQRSDQAPGGRSSWVDARAAYFRALTRTTDSERQQAFADTFRILGQLMHLVADLASPAHTRDDPHIFDGFEAFMAQRPDLVGGLVGFHTSILQQPTGDPVATVPVARIWDTDTYGGTNPEITIGNTVGLAEFTNANFFSDDTIVGQAFSDPNLPLPAIDRLTPGTIDVYPPTEEKRQYLKKEGDGVGIEHMVAEGTFLRFVPPFFFTIVPYTLDDLVYQDYARLLLPRAIGYSAGLLDYFFRGRLEVVVASENPSANLSEGLRVKVRNNTPDNQETASGTVVGVVEVQDGNTKSWFVSAAQDNVDINRVVAKDITLTFGGTPSSFPDKATLTLMVVYQGPLRFGNAQTGPGEDQAVVVGRAPLKPLDLNPKNPLLACGDPASKVTFTATGGLPPYTWSTTKGEITPIDAQNAELKPPDNPGSGIPGEAFWNVGTQVHDDPTCAPALSFGASFGCNGGFLNLVGEIAVTGYNPPLVCCCSSDVPDCQGCLQCTSYPICGSNFVLFYGIGYYLKTYPASGKVVDKRTQDMINQECRPCVLEMDGGATVTVTDAAGTPASTTVTVQ